MRDAFQAAGGGADAAPGIAAGPGHGAATLTVPASGPCRLSVAVPSARAVLSAPPNPPGVLASRGACVSSIMDMNIGGTYGLGNGLRLRLPYR